MIRYLTWTGFETEVFNVGSYRRKVGLAGADSNFFSAGNSEGQKMREKLALAVQDSMYEWLHARGYALHKFFLSSIHPPTSLSLSHTHTHMKYISVPIYSNSTRRVAIFDATNTTKERRQVLSHKARHEGVFLLFVESICDDDEVTLTLTLALTLTNPNPN